MSGFHPFRTLADQADDCAVLTLVAQLGDFTSTDLLIAY